MTPLELLQANVADYQSRKKDGPALLTALAETELFVRGFAKQLESMENGESLSGLREGGLAKFQEALGLLRKAVESGEGQAGLCEAALKLAEQADFLFGEALARTAAG